MTNGIKLRRREADWKDDCCKKDRVYNRRVINDNDDNKVQRYF